MKRFLIITATLAAGLTLGAVGQIAQAHPTELQVIHGRRQAEVIREFRRGDRIPVTFNTGGDLVETSEDVTQFVNIKKDFWVRIKSNSIEISLDGWNFKPFRDTLRGELSVSADPASDQIAINLQSFLK